jgi:predicted Zn-dependent protease
MKAAKRTLAVLLVSWVCLLAGCSEVGITGRRQFNIVPDSIVTSMAATQYSQFLSENEVSTGGKDAQMVQRVGERIRQAVDEYCRQYCEEDPFAGYQWEFKLVEDKAVNAWAMPGGKVVVYTGLLPVAQNEAGLAAVMGHEIAHVFADHGAERMSQQLLVQMGGIALSEALREQPEATQNLFVSSYGVGTQVALLLPFSRLHESEADRLGLIFMAMAGYDPREAVDFWQRMAEAGSGQGQPPEFLSTHPNYDTRISDIQALIPEAMEYYKPRSG